MTEKFCILNFEIFFKSSEILVLRCYWQIRDPNPNYSLHNIKLSENMFCTKSESLRSHYKKKKLEGKFASPFHTQNQAK